MTSPISWPEARRAWSTDAMVATSISVERIELPVPQRVPNATFTEVSTIWVDLEGAHGSGRGRARGSSRDDEAKAAAIAEWCGDDSIRRALDAADASDRPLTSWREAWRGFEARADSHLALSALAAVDEAVWELARTTGRLVSDASSHPPTPVYWSGLWLHSSVAELIAEVQWAFGEGFAGVKQRLDGSDVGGSIDRLRAVLAAAPPGRQVGLEFGGSGSVDSVEAIIDGVDASRLLWIEDPVATTDVAAANELAERLPVPVATGEDCWGRDALTTRLSEISPVMPIVDFGFLGGPTALWFLLDEHRLGDGDVGVHIDAQAGADVAAVVDSAQTIWLEDFPWWQDPLPSELDIAHRAGG